MLGNPKIAVVAVLMAGALVGGAASYVGLQHGDISKNKAGQKVASTLGQQTGTSYEVVKVEEDSGLYRVQLNSNNQLQTVYVSKDGKLLSGQMTDLNQLKQTVEMRSNVQSCLEEKDAVMYGNVSQQATQVQIQVLGGAQSVASYYKDINNPANLQEAVNRGVQSVPAIYLEEDKVLSNVNNLQQVSEFADC